MKNERHWQEQLIEIPLCDYEDLLIDRLELQERKKREKEINEPFRDFDKLRSMNSNE
jgi:sigma54-dependent transcription regulator